MRHRNPSLLLLVLMLPACAPLGGGGRARWLDGLGRHHHPVTTNSRRAQKEFDDGLRLMYAFHYEEATRSFEAAAAADPTCAMAWWGVGFAGGPHFHLPVDEDRLRKAREATNRAVQLAAGASGAERDYITALASRYAGDGATKTSLRAQDFADAMRDVSRKHPEDPDAATLFAESLMELRPYGLWSLEGEPQPGTREILETLEDVLTHHPDHPGANRDYISAVEGSQHPERGLPSAQRMSRLAPAAGHLVHMPAHVHMRLGNYAEAAEANRRALDVDHRYVDAVRPAGLYPLLSSSHYLHFLCVAASMEGRRGEALAAATRLLALVDAETVRALPAMEAYVPLLLLVQVRFGLWEEILAQPAPPAAQDYSTGVWHFARGMAFVARGKLPQAEEEQNAVDAALRKMPSDRILGENTPATTLLHIASHTLSAERAAARQKYKPAVGKLTAAVNMQDRLPWSAPPPWPWPVRESLGSVLLRAGEPRQAERAYRADLEHNPENGWALNGLARALRAQGKEGEAAAVDERLRKAWGRADTTPGSGSF